ncbi:hypothetical protein BJ944DRAFT_290378 [Cunninghamella echinulata]|nr:hypothetical protein BJ944DRAFT_290378 [Cunninghamella echinulata]
MTNIKYKEDWIIFYRAQYDTLKSYDDTKAISIDTLNKIKARLGKWYKRIIPSSRGFVIAIFPAGGVINTSYTGYSFASECVQEFGLVDRNATPTVIKEVLLEMFTIAILTEIAGESIPILGSIVAAKSANDIMHAILDKVYQRAVDVHTNKYITEAMN